MLNLNNVPQDQSSQKQEFSLIPKGTIARAVIIVKQGDTEIPEFGNGPWFKNLGTQVQNGWSLSLQLSVVNLIAVNFGIVFLLMAINGQKRYAAS